MILTLPVLLYQLLFVTVLYIASRFGRTPLNITLVLCLLWTGTHLFFLPLAMLQGAVLIGSYLVFRRRHARADTETKGRDRSSLSARND